jgi:hypothetical protein
MKTDFQFLIHHSQIHAEQFNAPGSPNQFVTERPNYRDFAPAAINVQPSTPSNLPYFQDRLPLRVVNH